MSGRHDRIGAGPYQPKSIWRMDAPFDAMKLPPPILFSPDGNNPKKQPKTNSANKQPNTYENPTPLIKKRIQQQRKQSTELIL